MSFVGRLGAVVKRVVKRGSPQVLLRVALLSATLISVVMVVSVFGTASCSQTTTNVPLRSFEYAQRMDLVCLQVNGPDGNAPAGPILPIPQPQSQCAPDPVNVNGFAQAYHLFALVTQVTRGEVAVVDLTAGTVVDVDRSTPGINFLPVGSLPTDIASTADGSMTYVASAQVDKPAIYALPSSRILGDSQTGPTGINPALLPSPVIPTLTTWPSCSLPEAPGPIAIVPTAVEQPDGAPAADAGPGPGYVLTVVLRGDGVTTAAKVITIDPAPLMRGAQLDAGAGSEVAPGSLAPCPIIGATELANTFAPVETAGPAWNDGVPYADGGIVAPLPDSGAVCNGPGAAQDGGLEPAEAGAGSLLPTPLAHASAAVRDGQYLYVADSALGVIHMIDITAPTRPREIAPLRATSLANPTRTVSVGQLALSPPTRNYQRFLYAIDASDGPASIMVYEVTDPLHSSHLPLTRPHPELNPFQPLDRIAFGSPVATVAFVQHDWPLTAPNGAVSNYAAQSGLLCNPNQYAVADGGAVIDPGAYYRPNEINNPEQVTSTTLSAWPSRLRGIFAFATLSNGTMVIIDVDDWDGPCRRPDPMGFDAGGPPSDIAPVEPFPSSPSDLNPYHAPIASQTGLTDPTSQEDYFPVSAPHRARSFYPLKDDITAGNHAPYLTNPPQLFTLESATLSGVGPGSAANPLILPTSTTLADPYGINIAGYASSPNVRFSWEDPLVQIDQNWTVTFEGSLPTLQGFRFTIDTTDHFQTLTLTTPANLLCRTGVEDLDVGATRAQAITKGIELFNSGNMLTGSQALAVPPGLTSRLVDYVQIADDLDQIAPNQDPYWSENNTHDGGADDCWAGVGVGGAEVTDPGDRYNLCAQTFGAASAQEPSRDFPILQAYADHFIIGTFYPYNQPPPRTAAPLASQEVYASNPAILKLVKCCFHNQMGLNVRTGGEWVATGSSSGLLHHVVSDSSGRCVQGCDPTQALMNSRSVGLIAGCFDSTGERQLPGCPGTAASCTTQVLPDRNDVLAMRNPMFSYITFNGTATAEADAGAGPPGGAMCNGAPVLEAIPPRDDVWKFSTRGQFTPYTINYASSSTSVSPQSMRFVSSFGQLAVVDGASQGLVLIDLNALQQAHAPYF